MDATAKDASQGKKTHYLSIHDLIHQLVNERISIKQKQQFIERATEVMLEVFSGDASTFTKKILSEPVHLLHARKLCENAQAIGYSSPSLLQLKVCVFECLMSSFRDFETASLYLKDIETDLHKGIKPLPYYEGLFYFIKGYAQSIHTKYEDGIESMKRGIALIKPFKEFETEQLRGFTNLIQYHMMLGDLETAEEYINKGNEIFKKSDLIGYNSLFLFAWSFVLTDQGKFKEALNVIDKVAQYTSLSKDYPALYHPILYQKADILIRLGKLEEAWDTLQECEKAVNEFFQGKLSIALANTQVYKSLVLLLQKKVTPAIFENLNKAIKTYESLFHGEKVHRNQARAYLVLGKAYVSTKEFEKALKAYRVSEEIYNKLVKKKNFDDLSDLYKELAILGIKMKDEAMANKHLKAHTEIFGFDHPRTKEIFHYADLLSMGTWSKGIN